jgi:hypothetical protein
MKTKVLLITPELARSILETNQHNRPLNQGQLAAFKQALLRGEWLLTHQGIAISRQGRLLDGQHRLHAIAETGMAVEMLVSTGLPDEVFTVLDTGSKRTAANVLSVNGASSAAAVAAAIKLYLLWRIPADLVWSGAMVRTNTTTALINEEYIGSKATWDAVAAVVKQDSRGGISIPGPMTCLLYIAFMHKGYSLTFLKRFLFELKEGCNLPEGSPLLAYRNKIMVQPSVRSQQRLADYIKLLNAYSKGARLKIFKSQPFPPMPEMLCASTSIYDDASA